MMPLRASLLLLALGASSFAMAEELLKPGALDERIRTAAYSADRVYPLTAYVGYQIDLQFAPGESFVGLAAGDIEGLSFVASGNHLFLKPKAAKVGTNLTVLTTKRTYQFDYSAIARRPDRDFDQVMYAVRFTYPPPPQPAKKPDMAPLADRELSKADESRPLNVDYWYCGDKSLKPTHAFDDGVHTRLTFAVNAELPAIFVRNGDGTESLLNFSMDEGDVVIHRVARQFVLRRGKLTGCIVNQGFTGAGLRLKSETVSPNVKRETRPLSSNVATGEGAP